MSKSAHSARPTVTAVVTSCRRFDLLEETLRSFLKYNDYHLDELIVIEDSDGDGIHIIEPILRATKHRIIINGENIGQIASIDKAYEKVASEYIFHFEDDWLFTTGGFIARAIEVLSQHPNVILANVRDDGDMPRYIKSLRTQKTALAQFKRVYPQVHFLWHTFTFNPGLKRTSDYHAISGGYVALGGEASISRYYKELDRDMAWIMGGGVRHTGNERSTYGSGWGYRKSAPAVSIRRLFRTENLKKWRESLRRRFWHCLRSIGLDTERLQRRRR